MVTRVIVAPDKFKGSLTATEVAASVAAGLRRAAPDLEVVQNPVADGGDGTLEAALDAGYERVPVRVCGPLGDPVDTPTPSATGPRSSRWWTRAGWSGCLPGNSRR